MPVSNSGIEPVAQWAARFEPERMALREAVRIGVDHLERGEFKEFQSIEDLTAYLNGISEKVISKAAE